MKKPKYPPCRIVAPRDKGYRDLTYPDRELTEAEIIMALEKKAANKTRDRLL